MHTAERKRKEKEERRQAILDAAERLFSARGYDSVTMEEVAREVQLATGTLYLYFDNKETLYTSVAMRGVNIFLQMIEDAMSRESQGLAKAYAGGMAFYEFAKKYPAYFQMVLVSEKKYESENVSEAIRNEYKGKAYRTYQITVDAIRLGIADGSIRPDVDPELTAVLLSETTRAMIRSQMAGLAKKDGRPRTRDEIVHYTIDSLKHAIESGECKQ